MYLSPPFWSFLNESRIFLAGLGERVTLVEGLFMRMRTRGGCQFLNIWYQISSFSRTDNTCEANFLLSSVFLQALGPGKE